VLGRQAGEYAGSIVTAPASNPTFWRGRNVVVTGGSGFLGSHVVARLTNQGAVVTSPRHADHDLTQPGVAERLFAAHRPSHVIHLAARVGGIGYNQVEPAPLFLDNLQMGVNVIEAARAAGVEKTVILGTVCSYPKFTPVPFREETIWDGYPEETNAPYGIAKKALLVLAQVNRRQYDQRSAFVIPSVQVWGTGAASRDYLYVGDAADAVVLAAELHDSSEPLNLGNNREITIRETVETIARLVGFTGDLVWDASKPDGQPRRCVDAARAHAALGWHAHTEFAAGLQTTIEWYLANRAAAEAAPR
jgi:GDP-L-fucose synthase